MAEHVFNLSQALPFLPSSLASPPSVGCMAIMGTNHRGTLTPRRASQSWFRLNRQCQPPPPPPTPPHQHPPQHHPTVHPHTEISHHHPTSPPHQRSSHPNRNPPPPRQGNRPHHPNNRTVAVTAPSNPRSPVRPWVNAVPVCAAGAGGQRVSRSHFLDRSLERARAILAQTIPRAQRPAVPKCPQGRPPLPSGQQHCQGWSHTNDPHCCPCAPPPPRPRTSLPPGHPKPAPATPPVQPPVRRRLRLGPDTRTLTHMGRGDPPKPKPKPAPAPRPRYHPYRRGHPHRSTSWPPHPYLYPSPIGLLLPPPPVLCRPPLCQLLSVY